MPNYADDILEVFDNFMAIYTDGSTDSFYDIMVIYEDVCGWSPADSMMEGDYKKSEKEERWLPVFGRHSSSKFS